MYKASAPDKFRDLEQVDPRVRETINQVASGELPWPLVLYGGVGSGKTCAALSMCDHYGGWYTSAADLCEMVTEAKMGRLRYPGVGGGQRTVGDIWSSWDRANLVILDEVGARRQVTDTAYETMYRAIDKREDRPLVVVTNSDLDGIGQVLDARIASRLSAGTRIKLTGDRRPQRGCKVV